MSINSIPRDVVGKIMSYLPVTTSVGTVHLTQKYWTEQFSNDGHLDLRRSNVNDQELMRTIDLYKRGCSKLVSIDLSHCSRITNTVLPSLKAIPTLSHLNLNYCAQITRSGIAAAHLDELPGLEFRPKREPYCDHVIM